MSDDTATDPKVYGANSYHYFHDSVKERAANGDVAPMAKPKLVATENKTEKKKVVAKNINKYSWADGKKFISYENYFSFFIYFIISTENESNKHPNRLYIDFDGIGAIQDQVTVEYRKRRFVILLSALL